MTIAERTKVLRFFAVDLTGYSSYEEVRLVVERSEPVPLRVRDFPYAPPALTVFATLQLAEAEVGADHRLLLEWVGEDGEVQARQEETLGLPADAIVAGPFPISFAVNFEGLRFAGPGICTARLGLDGEEMETLPVEVRAETTEP